jgi:hypothetical protein
MLQILCIATVHMYNISTMCIYNISTIRIYNCYLQAEKPAAQSSTFHFVRASQNKKSLPFANA